MNNNIVKPVLIAAIIIVLFIVAGNYLQKNPEDDQKKENKSSNDTVNSDNSNNAYTEKSPTITAASAPSGKVIYWMYVTWDKKKYKFEHYCDGSVKIYKNDSNHSGAVSPDSTHYYCIGRNQLFLNLDGELSGVKDETITEAKNAPLFTDLKRLSSGTVLISYAPNACITANDCGVGMPVNYETIAFNLTDNTFRDIKNYPKNGNAIWNKSGTKAVFYPETCGGVSCEEEAIIGYNLALDESKGVSNEKAAYDSYNCANGKNCWANCGFSSSGTENKCLSVWNNLRWLDNYKVSATIISPSGDKQEIAITF